MKKNVSKKFFLEQCEKHEDGDTIVLQYFTLVRETHRREGILVLHSFDHIVGTEIQLDHDLRFFAYIPVIPAFERT